MTAFSFLLLGRLESYLLHDMEDAMAGQVRMAQGGVELVLASVPLANLGELDQATVTILQGEITAMASQTGSRIVVTDSSGLEIIDSAGESLVGDRILYAEEIQEAKLAGYGAATKVDSLSGEYTMYIAYPFRSPDGEVSGIIRISRPTTSASNLLGTIKRRLALSGLIAGVVAVLVSFVFAMVLASPVRKIREAAVRFGRGDLGARSDIGGASEMAELSRSFDRMADRIERTVKELSELDSMKSEFVANVSHELRTPLTAIRGLSETLLDGAVNDSRVNRKFITDILGESRRLLSMVNNLLSLSRIEAGVDEFRAEPTDITVVIDRVVSGMAPVAELRGVDIITRLPDGGPPVSADSVKLEQAFSNVVENAVKYSPEGGTVSVTVEMGSSDGQGRMLITVTDGGPGIPSDELEHAFERFYRGKGGGASKPGSGLGLAIARHNVELHGGTIELSSEPGAGTTVVVSLPAGEPA